MADNVTLPATGAGDATPVISTEEVTTLNGGAVTAQQVQRAAIVTIASSGVADDVDSGNPLPVSVASVPGNVTVVQPTGTNLHTVVDSGTLTTVSTVTAVTGVTNPVTVIQGTATSLKTQAENYQGGVAVSAAAPLQVTLANTGSNATPVAVSSASAPSTSVTQGTSPWIVAGGGTAGSAATGVATIQGIASMTPVQVSQATGTNLHSVIDSGTLTTVSTVTAVTSITNPVTVAQATATSLKAEVIGAGTAGTANAGVVTVQGITSMTPLLVTPAANSAINLAQVAGATVQTGHGTATGAQRVELPTDGTGVIAGVTTVSTVTNVATIGTSVTPGTSAAHLGKAEDSGHTTADTGVFMLAVRQDSPDTAVTNTTADYSQISVSSTGAVRNAPMSEDFSALANGPQVKKYYANTGAVTDGIVWSPASGKRWYVTDLIVTTSAAATITFEDDLSGGDSIVLAGDFAANSGISHHFSTPLFSTEDAADLLVTTSAGNVKITAVGYEI